MKFRFAFPVIIVCCLTRVSLAQTNEESLEKAWEQIQNLKYHLPDSSIAVTKQAITMAERLNEELWKAKLYAELSLSFLEISKIDSSEYYNEQSKTINKAQIHNHGLAMNTFIDGFISSSKSQFVEAAEYYLKASELAKQDNNTYVSMNAYRGLSNMYINQRNEALAIKYAKASLNEAIKTNKPIEVAYSKKLLAEVYRVFENLVDAEILFTEAFHFFDLNNNPLGKAKTLANWSIMYEDDLDKCLSMEFEAQAILDEIAPTSGYSISNIYNIGWGFYDLYNLYPNVPENFRHFSKEKLLNEAKFNFEKSFAAAKKINNKQWEMFNMGVLAEVLYHQNSFKRAYELNDAYSRLRDSLFSQSNKNKIADLENRQKMLLKDQEIELKELKIGQKEKEKWFFISGLLLLFLVGVLLWQQNRIRKKNNDELRKLNKALTESNMFKAKLFSILNHDLRSPLSNLINLINLKNNNPELLDNKTKTRLENKAYSSAQNLLVSMEDLLVWCKNQMEQFEPKFEPCEVSSIFDEIKRYFAHYEKITFVFENEFTSSYQTDRNYLNTVCRNLTLNAVKSVVNQDDATIKWHCKKQGHELQFSISDNGPGFKNKGALFNSNKQNAKSVTQGLGIQIIEELTQALQGRIELENNSQPGCTISIWLPIKPTNVFRQPFKTVNLDFSH
jgi:signal transduction histidine kinase